MPQYRQTKVDKKGYARVLRVRIEQRYSGRPVPTGPIRWSEGDKGITRDLIDQYVLVSFPESRSGLRQSLATGNAGSEPGAPAQTGGVDWSLFPFVE